MYKRQFKYGKAEIAELPYLPFSYTDIRGNKIMLQEMLPKPKANGCWSKDTVSDYTGLEEIDNHKIFYLNLRNLSKGNTDFYYYSEKATAKSIINAKPYITPSRITDYYDSLESRIFDGRHLDIKVFSSYFSVDILPEVIQRLFVDKDCRALRALIEEQKMLMINLYL